jgi:MFS family permease
LSLERCRVRPLRWRLSLFLFLLYAPLGAVVPQFSLHLKLLGFSEVEIALACATQAVASMFGPLVAGQVADRWLAPERCILVCACLAAVLLWVLSGLTTPAGVVPATLAFWLLMGPTITLGTTVTLKSLESPERDYGRVRLWGTIGWVVPGWLIGLWLAAPGSATAWLAVIRPESPAPKMADAFRLASVLAGALAVYALTLPHTPPQKSLGSWLAPVAAFRLLHSRSFAVFVLGCLGVSMSLALNAQSAPLLLDSLGVRRSWVMPTLTIAQSTEVLTLALLPMLLLRLEMRGTMLLGLGTWATGLSVIALGAPLWLVVAAFGAWGACICCYLVAGQVYVNSQARGDIRASAQALLSCVNSLGMLLGNLLAGWVREQAGGAVQPAYVVAAALAGGVGLLFLTLFRAPQPR